MAGEEVEMTADRAVLLVVWMGLCFGAGTRSFCSSSDPGLAFQEGPREIGSLPESVRHHYNTPAGGVCFSRDFRRDRRNFAAVEAKIVQRVVIEPAKCVVDSPCLPTLPVARMRSACDRTGCLEHDDDDLAEGERAMVASGLMRLRTRR